MIIKRLVLHNFGIYANTNEFVFKGEKPVVLIGGLNGRGKTTFLEAVLIALYGSNSFAYMESRFKSYNQYLRSFVNTVDQSLETYIELEFSMDSADQEFYTVKRKWNSKTARTTEKIVVLKNGEENQFLSDNWAMFMENILPSGLSGFFFFDGEKIAELAVEASNKHMTESIKSLLGITVLDMLQSDIKRVAKRVMKEKTDNFETLELDLMREKRDSLLQKLELMDSQIRTYNAEIDKLKKQLEKKNQEYSAKGGDIVTQRQKLFEQRTRLIYDTEQLKETMLVDASSGLPLVLVKELLFDIREEAEAEHEQKMLNSALKKMRGVFAEFADSNQELAGGANAFINYFQNLSKESALKEIYNLSDISLLQLAGLLDDNLVKMKLNTKERQDKYTKSMKKIDELDNYLSVDIDEKKIARVYKQIKKLEQTITEVEVKLEAVIEERRSVNGEYMSINSEFNKKVDNYLKRVEANDDGERLQKYSEIATTVLDEYKIRLQKVKTSKVAETMTECYKKLAYKKNLIENIVMNPETLELSYLNKNNEQVPKSSLSAGEKQLMVISLLWALAICSKKKLPVIIDTPLSRMDSNHRKTLIKSYFPNASEQTIILSTDSEIDRKYYNIMRENIGDEFTLYYDDVNKSTTVKQGYLLEDE